MNLPRNKIYVVKPLTPPYEEYIKLIKDVFSTKSFTNNGVLLKNLEKKLCTHLRCNNISLFSSGHMSLYNLLKAMNLKGEVITTPYTFVSTTHAIIDNNLTPVFCDIKDDFTIDESKIESLITDKTSAIVAVHVYGFPCNVKEIEKIAKKHNLKVVYDAAHCFGVELNNESILNYGDASMISLHATKVYNSIEGGAVITKDRELIKKLNLMKNFGLNSEGESLYVGNNSKMDEFRAAMGLCNLKYVDKEIENRKRIVNRYIENLQEVKEITIPKYKESIKYNYAYFPILVDNRDELFDILKKNGIVCKKYYYPIVTEMACYKDIYKFKVDKSLYLADKVLVLPLYGELSLDIVDNVCEIILKSTDKKNKRFI